MKNQILDEPIRDSFIDFLDKGEPILWTDATEEKMAGLNDSFEKNNATITPSQFATSFVISFSLAFLLYVFSARSADLQNLIAVAVLGGFYISVLHLLKSAPPHEEAYVITPKRILLSTSYFPKNVIHQIHFSQIKSFTPQANSDQSVSFILVIKDPKTVPFKTLHRLQPTLEKIKDVKKVTQLLNDGIKNANTSL